MPCGPNRTTYCPTKGVPKIVSFSDIVDGTRIAAGGLSDFATGLVNPSVRRCVTGLSRAGKTVFITALVNALLKGGRFPAFEALSGGRITRCYLEPQPDDTLPRFAFEKFPQADPTLTTQMKSVGEAMAIGRTFKESLQKCLRSLEIGRSGLGERGLSRHRNEGIEARLSRLDAVEVTARQLDTRKLTCRQAFGEGGDFGGGEGGVPDSHFG